MMRAHWLLPLVFVLVGCLLMIGGIASGELSSVYDAATTICFSCIGIG